jgi:hypothetical protein
MIKNAAVVHFLKSKERREWELTVLRYRCLIRETRGSRSESKNEQSRIQIRVCVAYVCVRARTRVYILCVLGERTYAMNTHYYYVILPKYLTLAIIQQSESNTF